MNIEQVVLRRDPRSKPWRHAIRIASALLCSGLIACGGGGGFAEPDGTQPPSHALSVAVSGLSAANAGLALANGAETLQVGGDGSYSFATPIAYGGSYLITISAQPTGQTCTVNNPAGHGIVGAIAAVRVTCSTNAWPVSGTVTGLATGQRVVLLDNGTDALTVTTNGPFSFATPIAFNGSYAVTVGTQPTGQTCTVSNGSGTGMTGAISNVSVVCASTSFTIGGTVTGLPAGAQVTLLNNRTDPLTITADGSFTFTSPIAMNGSYAVSVGTQPAGASCVANNNSGTQVTANVTSVSVSCGSGDTLSMLKLSGHQLADAQWNVSACTTTTTCQIHSNTPGRIYSGLSPSSVVDWAACGTDAYASFTLNPDSATNATYPWIENVHRADGTVCAPLAAGYFAIAGHDASNNLYLFYVSSNGYTGTLVTANSRLSGAGFSFTGTSRPTVSQVNAYLAGM